jgi:cation diffusion facilitator CzcD-associated flavoprotein CzcO
MPAKPTTCVIGAGISGLTTGKSFSDWGLPYTCFEASDDIGGNWYFGNPNGRSSAYQSLHIDTSRDGVSFRDMPMGPGEYPDYPHHTQILSYLHRYADAFSLRDRIRFGTAVEHAERKSSGGWAITLGDGSTEEFDFLVVGNGHHWDPRFPDFPGEFAGEVLHSHHYIGPDDPLDLYGKRVLVVGIGNSAVDIVSELSRKGVAEKVFLSTRSGAWVMPKYFMGRPMDTLVKVNPRLPLGLQRRMARLLPRLASGRMEDFGLPHPNHHFLEAHPTVSSELLLRLGSGDAVAKPNVQKLEGDGVRFEDGTLEQIDAIVYATGYRITFPFFDADFLSAPDNRFPLYKRIFKPGIDDLAFVGFAQTIPTLFPFVELQSKLVARYAGGDYALPSPTEMEETINRDQRIHGGHYAERPRHTMQIEWYTYQHDIWSREIPAGRERAAGGMAAKLSGRVVTAEAAAA